MPMSTSGEYSAPSLNKSLAKESASAISSGVLTFDFLSLVAFFFSTTVTGVVVTRWIRRIDAP
ncbi:hypothetical protein Pcac1_g22665 [Phytophthora cactorum]|nr:hypothetical protein Pcac1_g22665 [Phytophthora cactorum]